MFCDVIAGTRPVPVLDNLNLHTCRKGDGMDLFGAAEQLDEARERLGGVCELLDCAAAAPDEIGAAGLAMLAERARQAYGDLACGIGLLERQQALESIEVDCLEGEREDDDFEDGIVFMS